MKKILQIGIVALICLFFVGLSVQVRDPEKTVPTDVVTEIPQMSIETEAPPTIPTKKIIDAPYIYQNIDYPNGCESVSAVMALKYLGIDISVDEFIDNYLDMGSLPTVNGIGPDPSMVFCGDPREKNSWGCYSSVIVNALHKFLDYEKYTVSSFRGKNLDELCREYIDRDIPVILWATVGMIDSSAEYWWARWATSDGKQISYNKKLHCLLLVGYDKDNYYFNDSMNQNYDGTSYTVYSKATTEKAYEILGKQSIVIIPK